MALKMASQVAPSTKSYRIDAFDDQDFEITSFEDDGCIVTAEGPGGNNNSFTNISNINDTGLPGSHITYVGIFARDNDSSLPVDEVATARMTQFGIEIVSDFEDTDIEPPCTTGPDIVPVDTSLCEAPLFSKVGTLRRH